jgi:hypothetical protein
MTKTKGILAPKVAWSAEHVAILRRRYPDERTDAIALDLGRDVRKVWAKAAALGLKKSVAYLASPQACRLRRGDNIGAEYRFKPGQVVWNKGTNFTAGGRSAETRFKPGQMPHNTNMIGSYRITKDGTLQRKIGNGKGNNSKRWRGVHELVWVEVNGPLPPKHIVVFKQGMRSNKLEEITIDRVECISLAENMRRNTVHNLPKELAVLVQLTGALNRKINGKQRRSASSDPVFSAGIDQRQKHGA